MSRAFVKENDDDGVEELPPRPARAQPCYMTAAGVARLKREQDSLRAETQHAESADDLGAKAARRRREFRIREIARILTEVVPVDPREHPAQDIRFGAWVSVRAQGGATQRFQIVGEDEVDPASGKISWVSPLGRQLLGRQTGDSVIWQRPAGALELEVTGYEYLEDDLAR